MGPLTRCPSGGGWGLTAAQAGTWHPCPAPSPILEPLPTRARSDEALGALDHPPPQEPGKGEVLHFRMLSTGAGSKEGR